MNIALILLITHITVAVASLGYAAGVISASRKEQLASAASRTKSMWFATTSTVVSGLALLPLGKGTLGRTCITLGMFLVVVGIAHYYQATVRRRVLQNI